MKFFASGSFCSSKTRNLPFFCPPSVLITFQNEKNTPLNPNKMIFLVIVLLDVVSDVCPVAIDGYYEEADEGDDVRDIG